MKARTARRRAIHRYLRREWRHGGQHLVPPCVFRQLDRDDRRCRYAYDMRSQRPIVPARVWQKWGMPEKIAQDRAEVHAAWEWCEREHADIPDHDTFLCAWGRLNRTVPA